MNELERFESLARRARSEPVPPLDVTARVLSQIGRIELRREVNLPLLAMSGLSVLAASIMVATVLNAWAPLMDPLAGLFSTLTLVVP